MTPMERYAQMPVTVFNETQFNGENQSNLQETVTLEKEGIFHRDNGTFVHDNGAVVDRSRSFLRENGTYVRDNRSFLLENGTFLQDNVTIRDSINIPFEETTATFLQDTEPSISNNMLFPEDSVAFLPTNSSSFHQINETFLAPALHHSVSTALIVYVCFGLACVVNVVGMVTVLRVIARRRCRRQHDLVHVFTAHQLLGQVLTCVSMLVAKAAQDAAVSPWLCVVVASLTTVSTALIVLSKALTTVERWMAVRRMRVRSAPCMSRRLMRLTIGLLWAVVAGVFILLMATVTAGDGERERSLMCMRPRSFYNKKVLLSIYLGLSVLTFLMLGFQLHSVKVAMEMQAQFCQIASKQHAMFEMMRDSRGEVLGVGGKSKRNAHDASAMAASATFGRESSRAGQNVRKHLCQSEAQEVDGPFRLGLSKEKSQRNESEGQGLQHLQKRKDFSEWKCQAHGGRDRFSAEKESSEERLQCLQCKCPKKEAPMRIGLGKETCERGDILMLSDCENSLGSAGCWCASIDGDKHVVGIGRKNSNHKKECSMSVQLNKAYVESPSMCGIACDQGCCRTLNVCEEIAHEIKCTGISEREVNFQNSFMNDIKSANSKGKRTSVKHTQRASGNGKDFTCKKQSLSMGENCSKRDSDNGTCRDNDVLCSCSSIDECENSDCERKMNVCNKSATNISLVDRSVEDKEVINEGYATRLTHGASCAIVTQQSDCAHTPALSTCIDDSNSVDSRIYSKSVIIASNKLCCENNLASYNSKQASELTDSGLELVNSGFTKEKSLVGYNGAMLKYGYDDDMGIIAHGIKKLQQYEPNDQDYACICGFENCAFHYDYENKEFVAHTLDIDAQIDDNGITNGSNETNVANKEMYDTQLATLSADAERGTSNEIIIKLNGKGRIQNLTLEGSNVKCTHEDDSAKVRERTVRNGGIQSDDVAICVNEHETYCVSSKTECIEIDALDNGGKDSKSDLISYAPKSEFLQSIKQTQDVEMQNVKQLRADPDGNERSQAHKNISKTHCQRNAETSLQMQDIHPEIYENEARNSAATNISLNATHQQGDNGYQSNNRVVPMATQQKKSQSRRSTKITEDWDSSLRKSIKKVTVTLVISQVLFMVTVVPLMLCATLALAFPGDSPIPMLVNTFLLVYVLLEPGVWLFRVSAYRAEVRSLVGGWSGKARVGGGGGGGGGRVTPQQPDLTNIATIQGIMEQ